MSSYESDFARALNRGRVYDSAEKLRATPEGTLITDAQGRHWIRGFNDPASRCGTGPRHARADYLSTPIAVIPANLANLHLDVGE